MEQETIHDSYCELLTATDSTLLGGFMCGCAERAKYQPKKRRKNVRRRRA